MSSISFPKPHADGCGIPPHRGESHITKKSPDHCWPGDSHFHPQLPERPSSPSPGRIGPMLQAGLLALPLFRRPSHRTCDSGALGRKSSLKLRGRDYSGGSAPGLHGFPFCLRIWRTCNRCGHGASSMEIVNENFHEKNTESLRVSHRYLTIMGYHAEPRTSPPPNEGGGSQQDVAMPSMDRMSKKCSAREGVRAPQMSRALGRTRHVQANSGADRACRTRCPSCRYAP